MGPDFPRQILAAGPAHSAQQHGNFQIAVGVGHVAVDSPPQPGQDHQSPILRVLLLQCLENCGQPSPVRIAQIVGRQDGLIDGGRLICIRLYGERLFPILARFLLFPRTQVGHAAPEEASHACVHILSDQVQGEFGRSLDGHGLVNHPDPGVIVVVPGDGFVEPGDAFLPGLSPQRQLRALHGQIAYFDPVHFLLLYEFFHQRGGVIQGGFGLVQPPDGDEEGGEAAPRVQSLFDGQIWLGSHAL